LISLHGGVGERFKPPVLKTGVHLVDREFESRPLRQSDSDIVKSALRHADGSLMLR
jgi:hypothetical protein